MSLNPDVERALSLLGAMGAVQELGVVVLPGVPWSKKRPRLGKGRTHSDPADAQAEQATGWRLRQVIRQPLQGNLAVACLFFRPDRHRVDVDNQLKHVMDAGNKIAWADDSQITALVGIVELDPGAPRTVVAIGRHMSTLGR